jgi:hypothetical protein
MKVLKHLIVEKGIFSSQLPPFPFNSSNKKMASKLNKGYKNTHC